MRDYKNGDFCEFLVCEDADRLPVRNMSVPQAVPLHDYEELPDRYKEVTRVFVILEMVVSIDSVLQTRAELTVHPNTTAFQIQWGGNADHAGVKCRPCRCAQLLWTTGF